MVRLILADETKPMTKLCRQCGCDLSRENYYRPEGTSLLCLPCGRAAVVRTGDRKTVGKTGDAAKQLPLETAVRE